MNENGAAGKFLTACNQQSPLTPEEYIAKMTTAQVRWMRKGDEQ